MKGTTEPPATDALWDDMADRRRGAVGLLVGLLLVRDCGWCATDADALLNEAVWLTERCVRRRQIGGVDTLSDHDRDILSNHVLVRDYGWSADDVEALLTEASMVAELSPVTLARFRQLRAFADQVLARKDGGSADGVVVVTTTRGCHDALARLELAALDMLADADECVQSAIVQGRPEAVVATLKDERDRLAPAVAPNGPGGRKGPSGDTLSDMTPQAVREGVARLREAGRKLQAEDQKLIPDTAGKTTGKDRHDER